MHSTQPDPELPDRVPEKPDALTPDLPPFGPAAPDLPDAAAGHPRPGSHDKHGNEEGDDGDGDGDGERPPAGPGNTRPQEPTD
ncbi:hypothetical protein AB0N09_39965 [Streptomyces erythrochromogenes]|uniref:hypothetical protein n=1 Tax=Streptomyces erythrochromogenes TaxID=285574 RepID=UPI003416DDDC